MRKSYSSLNLKFIFLLITLSFFGKISAQDTKVIIQNYLNLNKDKNGFTDKDIQNWEITNETFSKKTQIKHVYIRQVISKLPISNGLATCAIKNNEVVSFANRFVKNSESIAASSVPSITPEVAIVKAANQLGLAIPSHSKKTKTVQDFKYIYSKSGISKEFIPIELMYLYTKEGKLSLVWNLSIKDIKSNNWWSLRIDATTGLILEKNNWTVSCNFENCSTEEHAHLSHQTKNRLSSPFLLPTPPPVSSQYNVFPIPIESPNHGAQSIVSDPFNILASPFGWHDVDGITGNEYTITQGNNVLASEDTDNDDFPGYSPDGGSELNFIVSLNTNLTPQQNEDVAITNLFYMNNVMHDVWYQYGFDEESGNFQMNNYGKGGIEADYVFADA